MKWRIGLPTLLEMHDVWVCQYVPLDAGTTTSSGAVFEWRREGRARPVADDDLANLQESLEGLGLADHNRECTHDLGPRWMVAYSHDGDLTGVVVDDYGCRDVRLTDNPHTTPPGANDQNGMVDGVLDGGAAILDSLGIGREG